MDDAMAIYPATEKRLKSLLGLEVVDILDECEQFHKAKVVCFKQPYTKVMIDIFIMQNGEIYVSQVYGENMKREDMFFVKMKEGAV